MSAKDRTPPCNAEGPGCNDCGALHVHCLLPAGHDGNHHHDSHGTPCRPVTWAGGASPEGADDE